MSCQFPNFYDYVIGHDVIGYDVSRHPDIATMSSGVGLFNVENLLVIEGLESRIKVVAKLE